MRGKKISKWISILCLIVGLVVFVTSLSAVMAAEQKKIVWTFNQLPLGKWCDNKLYGEWLPKRMAEATGGRLELHVPIQLVPAPEILDAIRDGIIQGAIAGTEHYGGEWPLGSFMAIPGLIRADDEYPAVATAVAWDYWDKSLRKKYNIRLMGINHWPGINVYCREPVRTIKDFKGKKFRGMGYYDSLAIELVGAKGAMIPWGEAFLAVQRGVVDGLVTGMVVYDSMGFSEYCKYILKWPLHGSSCGSFIIVGGEAFDSLPDEIKPAVKKVLREAGEKNCACNITKVEGSLKAVKERGCKVIEPSAEDSQKLLEKTASVREKWIEQCEKAGDPEAREMLEKIEAFLADYRAKKGK